MARPMLSRGSTGQPVKLLQAGLNFDGNTAKAPLDTDGIFGPLTEARVKEFQRNVALAADGIVGPMTYEKLEPLLVILETLIDYNLVRPAAEQAARDAICATAERMYQHLGWGVIDLPHTFAQVGPTMPRILGKVSAGPVAGNPQRVHRQGGPALASLFRLARASNPQNCITMTTKNWQAYGGFGPGDNKNGTMPGKLTNADLPSWCGIFATAVYRLSGLKTQAWNIGGGNGGLKVKNLLKGTGATNPDFIQLLPGQKPKPGDIAIEDGQRSNGLNHHIIIVGIGTDGDTLTTIEGNAAHKDNFGFSEITKRGLGGIRAGRSLKAFRTGSGNGFLTPVWSQLGVK